MAVNNCHVAFNNALFDIHSPIEFCEPMAKFNAGLLSELESRRSIILSKALPGKSSTPFYYMILHVINFELVLSCNYMISCKKAKIYT